MDPEPSHIFSSISFAYIFLTEFNPELLGNFLSIIILLLCSGLLSGSEVAYFSLGPAERKQLLSEDTVPSSQRIISLLDMPRYLLSTILIANNIVNIAVILVSDAIIHKLMPDTWGMGYQLDFIIDGVITVGLVTFLLVLFGEVAPKIYANQNNMKIARWMSYILLLLQKLFRPMSWLLINSTQFVEQKFQDINTKAVSQEDIESAIDLSVKDNKYAQQDVDMLKGIVRFGNTCAVDIMKPRMKVVALKYESTFEELLLVFREEAYSRIPIYGEDLDDIKGIIHAKDILEHIGKKDFEWHTLIRPALVTPEKRKIDDLFHDFKEKRTHMAIVVDEYGGTEGIVTLEDVLEEIVGEIHDEFDGVEEDNYDKINEFTYEFDGDTTMVEICKVLNLKLDYFDEVRLGADTIAGLVLVLSGSMPSVNSFVSCLGYKIIILKKTERRIEKVRIIMDEKTEANATEA